MTPEQRIIQLEQQMMSINAVIDGLRNASQIDPEIVRTIGLTIISASSKSASSENRSVNEAGASTYSVLNPPDRFIKIGDKFIPAYDS